MNSGGSRSFAKGEGQLLFKPRKFFKMGMVCIVYGEISASHKLKITYYKLKITYYKITITFETWFESQYVAIAMNSGGSRRFAKGEGQLLFKPRKFFKMGMVCIVYGEISASHKLKITYYKLKITYYKITITFETWFESQYVAIAMSSGGSRSFAKGEGQLLFKPRKFFKMGMVCIVYGEISGGSGPELPLGFSTSD